MAGMIKPPLVISLSGTSLSSDGRLATPDNPWQRLWMRYLRGHPSCRGNVVLWNNAKGSAQSIWGKAMAEVYGPMRPTHVLRESFTVNNVAPITAVPQATGSIVPIATHEQDLEDEFTAYRGYNPDIVCAMMTMSPASAADGFRSQADMDAYEAAAIARATLIDVEVVDNYAAWDAEGLKPMPVPLTNEGDGLHPLFANAFQLTAWPLIQALGVRWMEDYWS